MRWMYDRPGRPAKPVTNCNSRRSRRRNNILKKRKEANSDDDKNKTESFLLNHAFWKIDSLERQAIWGGSDVRME